MPLGPVYGASYGDADLFSPPAAGSGGGTRRGARGLQGRDDHALEVEMERDLVPDISPPSLHLLLQPQPLLTLPAHHRQHNTLRSTFMLVPGS